MDYKLEVVVVPVSDVDRAKQFYAEQMGFVVDVDHAPERALPRRPAHAARIGLLGHDREGPRDHGPGLARRACSWWWTTSRPPTPS